MRAARGLCFQKVSEVEGLLRHVDEADARGPAAAPARDLDLLVTNEVVERDKLRRLCELSRHRRVMRMGVTVDDMGALEALLAEAGAGDARGLGVVIEIDVGQQRCGLDVESREGQAAFLALARRLVAAHREPDSRVRFLGIQAYHGGACNRRGRARARVRCQ